MENHTIRESWERMAKCAALQGIKESDIAKMQTMFYAGATAYLDVMRLLHRQVDYGVITNETASIAVENIELELDDYSREICERAERSPLNRRDN